MQNKLQELTDKLYNEGLSKGKQEAEQLKSTAKKEAEQIINDAKAQAAEIVEKAKGEAEELKSKSENDVRMAAAQSFSALKQEIEKMVITKSISQPIKESLSDKDFIESIITLIIKAFNPENADPVALSIILPSNKKDEFEKTIAQKITKLFNSGIEFSFSKNLDAGFKIQSKEDGYMLSFTNNDFESLIGEYLRPKTRNLLFEK